MTVLVVGGAGFIGSHACKALSNRGEAPVVFDNLSSGNAEAVKWGPLVRGDIRESAALDAVFAEHQPTAVMHFAARIEVGEGERQPLDYWDNNVGGVISLLQAMKRAGCSTLVFSSTCATYGAPSRMPIREAEEQAPENVYGRTKLAVEQMLADLARAGDLNYAALRYFNAAGASPDGEIGEEHDPETHLIPNALKAAAGVADRMKLFGDDYDTPDGTCLRDYIHVMDLAEAHLAALDRVRATSGGFACNIGTGRGVSNKEVLETVARITGRSVPFDIHPRRPGDVPVLIADVSEAKRLLDLKTDRSHIDQIVEDAWRFFAPRWAQGSKTEERPPRRDAARPLAM